MRSVEHSARGMPPFTSCYRIAVGFFRQPVDARSWHSHCLSERTSLEGSSWWLS
jgi:hypothetical protein